MWHGRMSEWGLLRFCAWRCLWSYLWLTYLHCIIIVFQFIRVVDADHSDVSSPQEIADFKLHCRDEYGCGPLNNFQRRGCNTQDGVKPWGIMITRDIRKSCMHPYCEVTIGCNVWKEVRRGFILQEPKVSYLAGLPPWNTNRKYCKIAVLPLSG